MKQHRRLSAAVALALAAMTVAIGDGRAVAAGRSPAGSAGPREPTVLLVNGTQVSTLSLPAGRAAYAVRPPGPGASGATLTMGTGGRTYEVPLIALPYLNRGLDASLFDMSALSAKEAGGRLPVQLTYLGRVPALPGVTVTRAAGGTAVGFLTATSARRFGAALARQFAADHRHASYGGDGLFGHGVTIRLAGVAPPPVSPPRYPMHTLTVHGVSEAGAPDTGDLVWVYDADSYGIFGNNFEAQNLFYGGTARFSVPDGHYWALAEFDEFDAKGSLTAVRLVVVPQFTVAGTTSARVDARAAARVTFTTPLPSVPQERYFMLVRTDAKGGRQVFKYGFPGDSVQFYISPTAGKPAVGKLLTWESARLVSPAGATSPYEYDVAFQPSAGLVGKQSFTVRPATLATVHASYFADVPATGAMFRFGFFKLQYAYGAVGFNLDPFRVPRRQTEYLTGDPALTWLDQFWEAAPSGSLFGGIGGQADSGGIIFAARRRYSESWNAYPLHVAANTENPGTFPTLVSASRAGNNLWLDFTPFSDSTQGHSGAGFLAGPGVATPGTYALYQNGTKIASGSVSSSGTTDLLVAATLRPPNSTIRYVLTAARAGGPFRLSTTSQTVWTWHSAYESGGVLPPAWFCGDGTQHCRAEPLLTLGYQVPALGLTGAAPPGAQVLKVSAGHLPLAKAPKITGVTVQVSVNAGKTWVPAKVTGSGTAFTADFTAPAGGKVSLRVTASDAAGGRIEETVINGYATS